MYPGEPDRARRYQQAFAMMRREPAGASNDSADRREHQQPWHRDPRGFRHCIRCLIAIRAERRGSIDGAKATGAI
ncbi:MAG: hypothetical protein QOE80_4092 [Actinomycetota bacterium]|nr:hypothetical protein [Actinomycetota bacterium]